MGDGADISIENFSNSSLNFNSFAFLLHNLLHVPTITKNFIFVLKFCIDNNCHFEFHATNLSIKDKETQKTLLTKLFRDGLYIFPTITPSLFSPSANVGEQTLIN